MTDKVLNIGDVFYTPYYCADRENYYVFNIKCWKHIVKDVITTKNSKCIKITYVDERGYKWNSKRISISPFTEDEALKRLKKYVIARNRFERELIIGRYIHD